MAKHRARLEVSNLDAALEKGEARGRGCPGRSPELLHSHDFSVGLGASKFEFCFYGTFWNFFPNICEVHLVESAQVEPAGREPAAPSSAVNKGPPSQEGSLVRSCAQRRPYSCHQRRQLMQQEEWQC